MRKRIYIAGPISKGILADNIRQGTDAAISLMRAGYAPFCPMLTCYMAGSTPAAMPHGTVHADWMGADLPWVAISHAILRLPGESVGADMETALAESLNIPVFHSLDELLAELQP